MKIVVAPSLASLLLLLVCSPACDDAKSPPQRADAKASADADAKVGAEVKAGADAKAGADGKVDAKVAAKVDAKAGAEAKAGSIAGVVADAKAADAKAADPKPDPVIEPAAPVKPGVAVSALHWASASGEGGRTTIDITDVKDLEGLMKLADEHGQPDGIGATFPATAKLPPGFATGDEWVIATTTGEKRGKAVGYGAYGGASEAHFIVVLDTPATGLTAKASDWVGPIPSLRETRPIDMATGPGKALFGRIKAPMAKAAEPAARAALGRKPIKAEHVSVIEGRFPNGFTHLVALTRPLAPAEEIGSDHVGGLLLADATGRVEAIVPPTMTINSDSFLFLVDLEGDGIDEVIYDDSYYEGSYTLLLTWTAAGKAEHRSLTGDGA